MSLRFGRLSAVARAAGLLALAGGSPALAQQAKGPTTCFKCHKPLPRAVWEQTAAFHKDSLQQLSAPKAAAFASAIGLPSPMTVTGRASDCVSCHATIVGGAVSTGVSCESCHGAASGYFNPHQEPEFYDQPVSKWLGLRNLFNDPRAIAEVCVNCHVTPDPRLKKAGHPAGESFDPGKGLAKMVHWPTDISAKRKRDGYGPALYSQVTAQAGPLTSRRLASVVATAAAPPAAASPAKGGAPASPPGASPARASAAADPFDWDQPVEELPSSYPGDAAAPAGTTPVMRAVPSASRAPSTAAELPPAPAAPPLLAPPAAAPAPGAVLPPKAPLPALRGRAVVLVTDLLKAKGAGQVVLPEPAPPREFGGPDGELLRLQDEALYLALETLRKKP